MLYRVADRIAGFIARWMAYLGGVILVALTLATCVNHWPGVGKVGRPRPIRGIFELTQIGIGRHFRLPRLLYPTGAKRPLICLSRFREAG